jgi:hypothetical protein
MWGEVEKLCKVFAEKYCLRQENWRSRQALKHMPTCSFLAEHHDQANQLMLPSSGIAQA